MYMYMCLLQDRIGGRVHTFKSGPYVADLGAMVITGLGECSAGLQTGPAAVFTLGIQPIWVGGCGMGVVNSYIKGFCILIPH